MGQRTCRNLTIYRKTSKTFQLNFRKDNNPVDITGWVIYFTCKVKMEDADTNALIKKDIESHYDASNGKTLIPLTPDDTDYRGNTYYDIKYVDDSGNAGILFTGQIKFREPVTTRGT